MATAVAERDYVRLSERAAADARRIDAARPRRQRRLQQEQAELWRRLPAAAARYQATGDREEQTALEERLIRLRDRLGDLQDGSGCRADAAGAIREYLLARPEARRQLDLALMIRSRAWGHVQRCERDLAMVGHPDQLSGLRPDHLQRAMAAADRARAELDGHREQAEADGRALADAMLAASGDGAARDLCAALNSCGLGAICWPLLSLLGEHGARVAYLIDEMMYPDEEV